MFVSKEYMWKNCRQRKATSPPPSTTTVSKSLQAADKAYLEVNSNLSKGEKPSPVSVDMLAVIVGAVSGLVVLGMVIVVMVIVLRRISKSRLHSSDSKQHKFCEVQLVPLQGKFIKY